MATKTIEAALQAAPISTSVITPPPRSASPKDAAISSVDAGCTDVVAGATIGFVAGGLAGRIGGGNTRSTINGAIIGGIAGAGIGYISHVRNLYRMTLVKFARLCDKSERTLRAWDKEGAPDEASLRPIRELEELHKGLSRIMEPDAIPIWMEKPNDAFDGSAPHQLIERGESGRLWRMISFIESGASF